MAQNGCCGWVCLLPSGSSSSFKGTVKSQRKALIMTQAGQKYTHMYTHPSTSMQTDIPQPHTWWRKNMHPNTLKRAQTRMQTPTGGLWVAPKAFTGLSKCSSATTVRRTSNTVINVFLLSAKNLHMKACQCEDKNSLWLMASSSYLPNWWGFNLNSDTPTKVQTQGTRMTVRTYAVHCAQRYSINLTVLFPSYYFPS